MRSKRTLVPLLLLFAFVAAFTPRMAEAQAAKRRPRIAVLDFDYATVQSSTSAMFGSNVDIGKGITELLVNDLVKDGTFSIIERQALDKIMAEQNFSNSHRADPSSAAKIGKLLGVDAIIVGSITQFGNETKKTRRRRRRRRLGRIRPGRRRPLQLQGQRRPSTPAWSTSTPARSSPWPRAPASPRAPAPRCWAAAATAWSSGGGNVDFGSSNFQETIIGEATKAAVDKLTAERGLQRPQDRRPHHHRRRPGRRGRWRPDRPQRRQTRPASSVGDQLEVVRVTKEIKDPATGSVIRRLTSSIGIIKATDVDDASAVCTAVSGSGFQTGDRVKSMAQ